MHFFLFTLLSLCSCLFIIAIFGMMKAGRRADEGEERILEAILLSALPDSITKSEETENTQIHRTSSPISISSI